MKKVALFAFNGEKSCFIHVLLNALAFKDQGYKVKIVVEGAATRLIPELTSEGDPLHLLFQKALAQGLVDGVCRACSAQMKVLEEVKRRNLPLLYEMSGHPSMARYEAEGYRIITF